VSEVVVLYSVFVWSERPSGCVRACVYVSCSERLLAVVLFTSARREYSMLLLLLLLLSWSCRLCRGR
jgi:hypothetical protein